jgi:hypothetical protein
MRNDIAEVIREAADLLKLRPKDRAAFGYDTAITICERWALERYPVEIPTGDERIALRYSFALMLAEGLTKGADIMRGTQTRRRRTKAAVRYA